MIDLGQLDKILDSERMTAESRDHDVLVEVERVRRDLDEIVEAIESGNGVASSTTGETAFASRARTLAHALHRRSEAYRVVGLLDGLRSRAEQEA